MGETYKKKLLLVDGHSILNRAFYGMPDLTNAKGMHTGAVYGFLNILFSQLDELKPDYLTVAFDVHAPTFRHEAYAEYKGTRKAMPEELREQVPLMKKMLTAMGIEIREQAGLEADDILGTLAKKAEAQDKTQRTRRRHILRINIRPIQRSRVIKQSRILKRPQAHKQLRRRK